MSTPPPATIKVLVIDQDGTITARRLPPTLEEFQAIVRGDIEALTLAPDLCAYINEEGKYTPGIVTNPIADILIRKELEASGRGLLPGDYIVGPVILLGPPDEEGEDTDVPDRVAEWLRECQAEIQVQS